MNTKIQKDKMCGMRKLLKNRESWQFSQELDKRNTMSEFGKKERRIIWLE